MDIIGSILRAFCAFILGYLLKKRRAIKIQDKEKAIVISRSAKIKSWYGSGGSLVTDKPLGGVTSEIKGTSAQQYYGGPYFIAESMTENAARIISVLLDLEYQGRVKP